MEIWKLIVANVGLTGQSWFYVQCPVQVPFLCLEPDKSCIGYSDWDSLVEKRLRWAWAEANFLTSFLGLMSCMMSNHYKDSSNWPNGKPLFYLENWCWQLCNMDRVAQTSIRNTNRTLESEPLNHCDLEKKINWNNTIAIM